MKKSPEVAQKLLERALKEMPQDAILGTARNCVHRAISELVKVGNKRAKREQVTPHQQWQLDLQKHTMTSPSVTKEALNAINGLIAKEQAKLNKNSSPIDDEESQEMIMG